MDISESNGFTGHINEELEASSSVLVYAGVSLAPILERIPPLDDKGPVLTAQSLQTYIESIYNGTFNYEHITPYVLSSIIFTFMYLYYTYCDRGDYYEEEFKAALLRLT